MLLFINLYSLNMFTQYHLKLKFTLEHVTFVHASTLTLQWQLHVWWYELCHWSMAMSTLDAVCAVEIRLHSRRPAPEVPLHLLPATSPLLDDVFSHREYTQHNHNEQQHTQADRHNDRNDVG